MFDFLFSFPRSRPVRRAPRRKFRFESLETRACPSSTPMGPLEPPTIGNFAAQVGTGQTVNISGQVQDYNPGGLPAQVTLSGVISATVTTDSNGNFSYQGTASALGTEYATATDADAMTSSQVSTSVYDPGPSFTSFTINYVYGSGNKFTLAGDVGSPSGLSLPVTFAGGGLGVGGTTANGNFSVTTTASSSGTVTATATDVWGVKGSAQATLTLPPPPPEITSFTSVNEGNGYWLLEGTVTDQHLSGINVEFSGLVPASGTSVDPNTGAFSETVMVGSNLTGDEYAIAVDSWGQQSNKATTLIG